MAEELESDPLEVEDLSHLGLEQPEQLSSSELETLANIQAELDSLNNSELEHIDSAQIPTLSQSVEIGSSLDTELENDESLFITEETVESTGTEPRTDEEDEDNASEYIEVETVEETFDSPTDISNLDIIMQDNIETIEEPETIALPEEQVEDIKPPTTFVPIVIQSSATTSNTQAPVIFNSGDFFIQQMTNTANTKTNIANKFMQITNPRNIKKPIVTGTHLTATSVPQVPIRTLAPTSTPGPGGSGKLYAKVVITSTPQSIQKNQVVLTSQAKESLQNSQPLKMESHTSPIISSFTSNAPPKAIPLAQAKQMGLLSGNKLQRIVPFSNIYNQGVIQGKNKIVGPALPGKIAMVTSATSNITKSPTKILPAPTSGITKITKIPPTIKPIPNPQKVIIRQTTGPEQIVTQGVTGQVIKLPATPGTHIQGNPQLQYVRLVTTSGAKTPINVASPKTTSSAPKPVALISKLVPKATITPVGQRILIPAETTSNPIGTGGTLIPTNANSYVMIPAPYIPQVKGTTPVAKVATPPNLVPSTNIVSETKMNTNLVTEKISIPSTSPITASSAPSTLQNTIVPPKQASPNRTSIEPNGIRPRKPCNCTKSQCLKLYCDCFANGEFCHLCNCNNCFNNLSHEEDRQTAIKACLERNPNAFRPKIGKGKIGDERRHNKGCNCKRSNCLKNYCECFEAKIPCSNNCKCIGCHNIEDGTDKKQRTTLADPVEMRETHQMNIRNKFTASHATETSSSKKNKTKKPFSFIESRVIRATCSNLLNEAKKAMRKDLNPVETEHLLLQNFGKCLKQVIDSANEYESKFKDDFHESRSIIDISALMN